MKKAIALALVLALALTLLAGCSGGAASSEPSGSDTDATVASFKTIGDAMNCAGAEFRQSASSGSYYVYVFSLKGTFYRVIAKMTEAQSAALFDLDILADDYDAKLNALVAPLAIEKYENLTKSIPPQEELDKLVGKKGGEVFDDEWYSNGWNLDEMVFWMTHGMFRYDVVMEGAIENPDAFDESMINDLVIRSVTFSDIGDATEIEE